MFNNKPLLSFDKIFDCAQMLLVYSIKTEYHEQFCWDSIRVNYDKIIRECPWLLSC